MLAISLLVWAWNLCQSYAEADQCSTYLAFDDLSLAADEEFERGWHEIGHEEAATDQPRKFGFPHSLEFAASIINPDNYYSEITVEVFIGNPYEGLEIVKSCKLNTLMPRSRRCCETAFFYDGIQNVGVNATCHKVGCTFKKT